MRTESEARTAHEIEELDEERNEIMSNEVYNEECDEECDEEYDEEYDEEGDDEEDDVEGLSAKELELIATDYAEPISDDSIEELKYLLDSYFKIQKVNPELKEEEELKAYALEVIRAIVMEYDIPADDVAYLFKFVLTLESYYEKHSKDVIFKDVDKEEDLKTLKLRVDEYLNENPDLFDDLEVYATLFDIEKPLNDTKLYEATLDNFYKMLVDAASVETFEMLLDLYVENKPKAEKNFAAMPIPSATEDEMVQSFFILTGCEHSGSTLRKKIEDLKALILQKYSESVLLKEMLAELETKQANAKTAKTYKMVKFGSLALAVVLLLINAILGIVTVCAWGALFFSPLHDKVPFLVKGKESLNK